MFLKLQFNFYNLFLQGRKFLGEQRGLWPATYTVWSVGLTLLQVRLPKWATFTHGSLIAFKPSFFPQTPGEREDIVLVHQLQIDVMLFHQYHFINMLLKKHICWGTQKTCSWRNLAKEGWIVDEAHHRPHMGNHSPQPHPCQFFIQSFLILHSGLFGATQKANPRYLSKRGAQDWICQTLGFQIFQVLLFKVLIHKANIVILSHCFIQLFGARTSRIRFTIGELTSKSAKRTRYHVVFLQRRKLVSTWQARNHKHISLILSCFIFLEGMPTGWTNHEPNAVKDLIYQVYPWLTRHEDCLLLGTGFKIESLKTNWRTSRVTRWFPCFPACWDWNWDCDRLVLKQVFGSFFKT